MIIDALGQSQPSAGACLKINTSIGFSFFSKLSKFSLWSDNQIAIFPLLKVKSYSFNSLIVNQKKHSFYNGKSFFLKSNFIRNDIVNNLFSEDKYSEFNEVALGL